MPKRRPAKSKPRAKRASAGALALAGDCCIPQVDALKSKLSRLLARATPVMLDASNVTRVDTSSLQLLAAFVRERQAKGRLIVWHGVSCTLEDAARRLGLDTALLLRRA